MIYTVKTGEPEYFKCACQRCGKHIEFPSNGAGVTVDCPHCGKKTVLGVATDSSPTAVKSKKSLWVATGLIAMVAVGGVGAFLWIQKQKPKETAITAGAKPAVAAVSPLVASAATTNKALASEEPAVTAETVDDFSVGKISLQKMQGSSLVYAVGTAKNSTGRQRFGVRIELNLLDKQDRNVGVVSDYISVVEPHKDWQFKALLTHTGVAKVTVADIKEQ